VVEAGVTASFLDPGPLADGDLSLVVAERIPADPVKGWVPAYHFEMRHTFDGVKMGRLRLRIGDGALELRYAGNIGYDVDEAFRGHRYASRSISLILPLCRAHGLREAWIGYRPENAASRRTCEVAGAEWVETVAVPEDQLLFQMGVSITCRYRLRLSLHPE
jgi:tagatose 1,6-diphosphate aldolase